MKVFGSGSPRTLTVRIQRAEIVLWRQVLRDHLLEASTDAAPAIARLMQRAHEPVDPGQPCVMVGPTPRLAEVIAAVAEAAHDRLTEAWRRFGENPDLEHAERLRIALDTTDAAIATAVALARVQNDAATV